MSGRKMITRWMTLCAVVIAVSLVLSAPGAYGQAKDGPRRFEHGKPEKTLKRSRCRPCNVKEIIAARPYKSVDELKKAGLLCQTDRLDQPYVMVGAAPAGAPAAAAPVAKPAPAAAAPAAAAPAKAAKAPTAEKASPAKLAPGETVNINSASKEKLDALPGIGPVKAQAIIDGGPTRSPRTS